MQPRHFSKLAFPCLSALIFCALMFLFYPYRTTFQFDTDEGVNLIKGRLVESGYPLYEAAWSDQPPVFTLALARLFPWVEQDLNAARNLVLAFAGLLVGCLAYVVQEIWGARRALLAVFLLLLVPYFPALSVSVMIGLPAIALAFLSLASLTAWHAARDKRTRPVWLLLSGAALGLSVMTKLFTGLLAPVFLGGIILEAAYRASRESDRSKWRAGLAPVLQWSAAFGLVVGGFGLLVIGPAHLAELVLPHLQAGQTGYYAGYQQEFSRSDLLAGAIPIFGLALLGAWSALRQRRWLVLYLLAWTVGGLAMLALVSPVWYHHTLLATLPACCLAAGGLGEVFSGLASLFRRRKLLLSPVLSAVAGLSLLAVFLWQRLPPVLEEFDHQPYFITLRTAQPAREQVILDEIAPYRSQARWMFTDLPLYAFRAGILVPPELAVITSKRLASGELPQAEIARLVEQYQPEVILLGRFDFPELSPILSARYVLLSSHLDTHLYLRADLPEQP